MRVLALILALASLSCFAQKTDVHCENIKDGTLIFMTKGPAPDQLSLDHDYFGVNEYKAQLPLRPAGKGVYHFNRPEDKNHLSLEMENIVLKKGMQEFTASIEVYKDEEISAPKKYKCTYYK